MAKTKDLDNLSEEGLIAANQVIMRERDEAEEKFKERQIEIKEARDRRRYSDQIAALSSAERAALLDALVKVEEV